MFARRACLIASLFVVGCGKAASDAPFDAATTTLLRSADRVEVYRLDGMDGPPEAKERPGDVRLHGYLVTSRAPDQGGDFAHKLADVLTHRDAYTVMSANCYWPGLGFRFHDGDNVVDVLICFQCNNVRFFRPGGAEKTRSFLNSPLRSRLVDLAKEAFPADEEIKQLK